MENQLNVLLRNPEVVAIYQSVGTVFKVRWRDRCWILEGFERGDAGQIIDVWKVAGVCEADLDVVCNEKGLKQAC